ncbi:hypothetical protein ABEW05_001676 [Botrytis cinerea]
MNEMYLKNEMKVPPSISDARSSLYDCLNANQNDGWNEEAIAQAYIGIGKWYNQSEEEENKDKDRNEKSSKVRNGKSEKRARRKGEEYKEEGAEDETDEDNIVMRKSKRSRRKIAAKAVPHQPRVSTLPTEMPKMMTRRAGWQMMRARVLVMDFHAWGRKCWEGVDW